jgi:hypothetical protein
MLLRLLILLMLQLCFSTVRTTISLTSALDQLPLLLLPLCFSIIVT